jgi:hypothetical protein
MNIEIASGRLSRTTRGDEMSKEHKRQVRELDLKVPLFQGNGPFGFAVGGPFSITAAQAAQPTAIVSIVAQTSATEKQPCRLILQGKHIAEFAYLLLQFARQWSISPPVKVKKKFRWQTATSDDGNYILLRVLEGAETQVDLVMKPGDAMKLRDELDQRCRDWKGEFARH